MLIIIIKIIPYIILTNGLAPLVMSLIETECDCYFNRGLLQALLGAGILFYVFGAVAVVSLVFIYFIVPETKGLTLEEIEAKCI